MKKPIQNKYVPLEKTFAIAGLVVIIVGCVANLYSAYFNQRFIHDPADFLYYFRYIILLGGGFTAGYLLSKKLSKPAPDVALFRGITYALLAVALFLLFDVARLAFETTFGQLSYPWGKLLFTNIPLLAAIATLIIAYFSQYKPKHPSVSGFSKLALLISFVLYQVFILASDIYYLIKGSAAYDPSSPLWLIVGSYLISPIAITIISYLVLSKVRQRFNRAFYAVLIGMLYSVFSFVLWEFRTEASYEATTVFSAIATALSLVFVGAILWQTRRISQKGSVLE